MGDPRDTNGTGQKTLHGYVSNTEARPDSPAWGGGAGRFASPLQYGRSGGLPLHRQTAPAAVTSDQQPGYSPSELWDGAVCIATARLLAEFSYAPGAIKEETGRTLDEILEGLLPGLVMTGCAVGICTLLGGVVGGVVGSLAFGAGAVPGAVIGAEVGFDVGMALVTWLGVGFLIVHVAESLGDVTKAMVEGVELAWNARGRSEPARSKLIHAGAKRMAQGIAVFFRLLLEGVVIYLLEKGAPAVAARLSELVAKLKFSPRGEALAVWVTKNYKSLLDDPKVNPKLRARKGGGDSTPKESTSDATTATRPKTSGTPAKSGKPKSDEPKTADDASKKLRNKYQKRTPEEVEKLRKEFDGKNGARAKFVKQYADSPEAANRFTPAQLEKMKKSGQMPKGWVVHHKQPLFRGGDNSPANMRVMKDTFHRTHSKKLHYYPEGQNPYGRN